MLRCTSVVGFAILAWPAIVTQAQPVPFVQANAPNGDGRDSVEGTESERISRAVIPASCCVGPACFDDVTETECEALCGEWRLGTTCDDPSEPCGFITTHPACCVHDRCIGGADEETCDCAGGVWYPDESCSSVDCSVGACCVDGSCFEDLTEAECEALCGSWRPGSPCLVCALAIGVCCVAGECDPGLGPDACACAGGTWHFTLPDEGCEDVECPPVGACCLPDGQCLIMTQDVCEAPAVGGSYQGDGTECLGDNDGDGIDDACECRPCECDQDENGDCNGSDLVIVLDCLGLPPTPPCELADNDCDGDIDDFDLCAFLCLLSGLPADQCCVPNSLCGACCSAWGLSLIHI